MPLAAAPARALDACFADSVGPWRGPVWNGPGLEMMDTDFSFGPDGSLTGHYHVFDTDPFDGTLTDFQQTGHCEANFVWTDRFGTGTVHIRFEPEIGRFIGNWGGQGVAPTLEFDGFRKRPPAVS
ncbi:MAG TPA: hypothetical protein VKT26_06265 [Acetobacteraceae bacterium]|nr:hypothetical protein [Acetobacteraceae bacterium]